MKTLIRVLAVFGLVIGTTVVAVAQQEAVETSRQAALARVTEGIRYLASDELGGRLPGTEGIEKAAQFIEKEFKAVGLKPLPNGTYRQEFTVTQGREVDPDATALTISVAGHESPYKLGDDFMPQLGRAGYETTGDLVFVGYGITAEDLNYDEYRGVDVNDKIVVMIRREPQQDNPDSVFDGTEVSPYSYIQSKVNQAREAGAAGIIMVNDGFTAKDDAADVLAAADEFGAATSRIPFVHVKRRVINDVLKKSPLVLADGTKVDNLDDIERHIDKTLEPVSQPIENATATLKAGFSRKDVATSNIIGIIEGEGPHADEVIVIGGHYDHLGLGGFGSRAGGRREIHNGADDNATGTVGVMELARRFAQRDKKPARTMVFIAFSAEEMGLLGARHYVENPIYPLEQTVAMINFDMIGWLRDDKLTAFNWNSAAEFEPALDKANEGMGLDLVKPVSGFGGSDHLPFFQRQIPVMFLHTGLTSTYHTPEDDFETIDCEGALRVIEFTERLLDILANQESTPKFVAAPPRPQRVRLGVSLNSSHEKGVEITRVREDSIASKAGLQPGDVIVAIDGEKVEDRRGVNAAVAKKNGKTAVFKILRADKEMEIPVTIKEGD